MKTLLFLLSAAALVVAPAAAGDGFFGPAAQLGNGIVSPDGTTRYVAAPSGANTTLLAIQIKSGLILNEQQLVGAYGIPVLGSSLISDGLSHDGHTLVLGDTQQLAHSHFLVYDTRTFRLKNAIVLKGTFGF